MILTSLLALAAAPAALAAWGDACIGRNGDTDVDGTCVRTSQCPSGGTITPGRCPNDPEDIKCCWVANCHRIDHGRCPGGNNIKCWPTVNLCFFVETGKCPGGSDVLFVGSPYLVDGRTVPCS